MRFHMIDRIEAIHYGKYVTAVKCISLSDDVFNEHFPGYPIFPGSLILEGLAQLGGSFFEITMQDKGLPLKHAVLAIVRQFKLRKPAGPGDRLVYRAEILSMQDEYGVANVTATLDNEPCAEGELMFHFVLLPNDKIQQSRNELYGIVTKGMKVVRDDRPL
jgi:3-hydroxyacyl-[acyl-carrier-protein] dehydratase